METSAEYLLRKGKETGIRRVFLDLLNAKFGEVPAAVVARVQAAEVDRLTTWVGVSSRP